MENGVCTKRYPREFNNYTTESKDGYPTYRRRDDGRRVTVHKSGGRVFELDNRWVVPHNLYLAKKYDCRRFVGLGNIHLALILLPY
jgi:hypothetical protein